MSSPPDHWQEQVKRVGLLRVRVTPKASRNCIKVEQDEEGKWLLRVYVTTVPEDGKANKDVIKLLAKELGLAKSCLEIEKGLTSREKIVNISDG